MPFTRFINYWDSIANAWFTDSYKAMTSHICFIQKSIKTQLEENGMPEPYLGNPLSCSAVIININPGPINSYNDICCQHMSMNFIGYYLNKKKKYHDYANAFPYWNLFCVGGGFHWWDVRRKWINGFFNTSVKIPFALEICPWHSSKWKGMKFGNLLLKTYIKEYVIEPACNAIAQNNIPYGLIIGKAVCDAIIKSDMKNKTTSNWSWIAKWNQDTGIPGAIWPTNFVNGITRKIARTYGILSNGNTIFLCTWAPGSNGTPSNDFRVKGGVEEQIRYIIKTLQKD